MPENESFAYSKYSPLFVEKGCFCFLSAALQLHPDKNKHPKAEVAFKLVSEVRLLYLLFILLVALEVGMDWIAW